jgi:hypothetical protein
MKILVDVDHPSDTAVLVEREWERVRARGGEKKLGLG